jgi:hypothetical protein
LIRPKTLYVSALGELHCLATTDLRSTRRHLRVVGKHELLTKHGLHSAKTLNFSVATSGPRLLTAKLKDFAFPLRRCSHRALFPWPPLRQASRCRIPQRTITAVRSERFRENISKSALNLSPAGDCACPFLRTDSEFCWECDHLRRPRGAFGRSDPTLPLGKPDAPLRVRRTSHDCS